MQHANLYYKWLLKLFLLIGIGWGMKGVSIKPLCFKENLVPLGGKRIKKSEIWYRPQPRVHTLSRKVHFKVWSGINSHQHFEGRVLTINENVSVPHNSCELISLENEGDKRLKESAILIMSLFDSYPFPSYWSIIDK